MTPEEIEQRAREQALEIAGRLVAEKVKIPVKKGEKEPTNETEARDYLAGTQMVAVIAYLQKLGAFDVVAPPEKPEPTKPRTIMPGIPDKLRPAPKAEPAPTAPPAAPAPSITTARN
jgi:hypothetical protein